MRKILYCIVALILVACGNGKKPDFAAANAAKEYYSLLLEGKAEAFVDKMDMQDSIPEVYREQLVANIKMYLAQQQQEHRGIKKVDVQNCINDSLQPTALAFLMICYGDSTVEEIVVPMVKRDGRWLMR
ncbi:MAG: hypothetical protein J6X46_05660 [Prevotella sp.]|nr:hypothetical protein [Prevotella sp.]